MEDLWEKRKGLKFNKLELIEYIGNGKCKFICECDNETIKNYRDVSKGKTKSCGCLKLKQRLPNLVGVKYNKLTAIKELDIRDGQRCYLFKCDCGNEKEIMIKEVRRGKIKSCSCEVGINVGAKPTHGLSKHPLYHTYSNMIKRCTDVNNINYHNYGGRGINVDDLWLNDIHSFIEWSNENGYQEGLTLDRINNDGNYEPSNCRWVTMKIQANNRRNNLMYEYKGEIHTLAEWCDILNLNYYTVHKRINKYGYSIEDALKVEVRIIK